MAKSYFTKWSKNVPQKMGSISPYTMVKSYFTKWSKQRAAKNWAAFPLTQW
jgi:hypothetical protein